MMADYMSNLIGAVSTTRDNISVDSFRKNGSMKKNIIVGQLNSHRTFKAAENLRDWFHLNVGKKRRFKLGILLIQEPYLINNRIYC